MGIDNFVNSVVYKDAEDHAIDFARLLNECSEKDIILNTFLHELNKESRFALENEMEFVG